MVLPHISFVLLLAAEFVCCLLLVSKERVCQSCCSGSASRVCLAVISWQVAETGLLAVEQICTIQQTIKIVLQLGILHFMYQLKGIARWLEVRNLKFSSLTQVQFIQIDAKRTIYHITTLRREAASYCTFEA